MKTTDYTHLEDLPAFEPNKKAKNIAPGAAKKQCQGKASFRTFERARMSARKVGLGNTGRKMHAYRCEFCRRWHIGH